MTNLSETALDAIGEIDTLLARLVTVATDDELRGQDRRQVLTYLVRQLSALRRFENGRWAQVDPIVSRLSRERYHAFREGAGTSSPESLGKPCGITRSAVEQLLERGAALYGNDPEARTVYLNRRKSPPTAAWPAPMIVIDQAVPVPALIQAESASAFVGIPLNDAA
ncbi:hypothetical protein AB0J83_30915 [Actinoplanes sp. NPDC049596]|uniref:hypothetical protein n=1 Tax=unclassified Actinoplanes TaxID=2626549 RepID=UPI003433B3BA